jgi:hypothetical protein
MASGIDFKTVDPVDHLFASGSGGGGGLPLTGGTLTGNLVMQVPSIVSQCQPPTGPCDLTNKQYVDGLLAGGPFLPLAGGSLSGNLVLTSPAKVQQTQAPTVGDDLVNKTYVDGAFQAKKPAAVTNNIAAFGAGADLGQTIDSGVQINDLVVGINTLFTSDKTMSQIRKAFFVISNTAPTDSIAHKETVNLFISNDQIGPSEWPVPLPNDGTAFSVNGSGVVSITNLDTGNKTYRITFISGGLNEQSGPPALDGTVEIQFFDETGGTPTQVGLTDHLRCLASATLPQFVNKVVNTITVNIGPVAPNNVFSFSVAATNLIEATKVILDPDAPLFDSSKLVIERIC